MTKLVLFAASITILGACLHVGAAMADQPVRFKTTAEIARALDRPSVREWIPARLVSTGPRTLTFALGPRREPVEIPRAAVRELQVRREGSRGPWISTSPQRLP